MKKILLIEDEAGVVEFIKKGLTEENFEVSVAFDGNSAISMAIDSTFDLFILDILLPDKNGIDVCKELRQMNIKAPILFLSALGTSENIANGLNIGADDYLVKPFKFIELKARVNALLRRASQKENGSNDQNSESITYFISDLAINDTAKEVRRNDLLISLTATEYRLLLILIKNKNKVLSRMQLLEFVWDINFNVGTNVVDVYINYLRKKIDSNSENKLIHTVAGMGYILKE
ncbi:MAG: response regulator transcription factor [Bacteroidia bacterium]|nr:response regulator transcription factor [Bacteroidia bacterium]